MIVIDLREQEWRQPCVAERLLVIMHDATKTHAERSAAARKLATLASEAAKSLDKEARELMREVVRARTRTGVVTA